MQQVAQTPAPVRRRTRASIVSEALVPPTPVPASDRAVVATDNGGPVFTVEMKAALAEFADANTRKNAGARDEKAAKKKLHELMAKAEIEEGHDVINGKRWEATIAAEDTVTVDVALLKTLVDEATFMTIVSATQAAVTKAVGTNMLAKCSTTVTGEKTLSIKGK